MGVGEKERLRFPIKAENTMHTSRALFTVIYWREPSISAKAGIQRIEHPPWIPDQVGNDLLWEDR
jgi:hypothetical protein